MGVRVIRLEIDLIDIYAVVIIGEFALIVEKNDVIGHLVKGSQVPWEVMSFSRVLRGLYIITESLGR